MRERFSRKASPSNAGLQPKRALITGITGQDGSYLAEFLVSKDYDVHGLVRRVAMEDSESRLSRIWHLLDRITLYDGSIESDTSVCRVVEQVQPDECYHLAAQSFVSSSFQDERTTLNTNIIGTTSVLSAVHRLAPGCRFYFAGSSQMFGRVAETPQREPTPFRPCSPYGISKVTGYHLTRSYRETWGMHAGSGILFNHESPRRGTEFVTRKITSSVARIVAGKQHKLLLGNLEARRDWGHAGLSWDDHVVVDPTLRRPAKVDALLGDATKAREKLGWRPRISLSELVCEMVESDLAAQNIPFPSTARALAR